MRQRRRHLPSSSVNDSVTYTKRIWKRRYVNDAWEQEKDDPRLVRNLQWQLSHNVS